MRSWRILRVSNLLVTIVVVLSFAAYRYLNGPFPQRLLAERHFGNHRIALQNFYERLRADGFESFKCYPDTVYVDTDPKGPGAKLEAGKLIDYLVLCSEARAVRGWEIEKGFLFYAGASHDGGYSFNIAFIRVEGPSDRVDCETLKPEGDFGACAYHLAQDWVLDYEWVSDEYIRKFTDDAA